MKFERDLLLQAVKSCNNGELHLTSPPEHYEKWMSDRCLPRELVEFLRITAFSAEMSIGDCTLHDFRRIRSWDRDFQAFIDQGLISVGSSCGGDPILIDFREDGRTGFLSHDEPYYATDAKLRRMFRPIAPSIGEFAIMSAKEID